VTIFKTPVTKKITGQPRNRDLIHGTGKAFFSSSICPDQLCGPLSLIFYKYWNFDPKVYTLALL
jgi:hypothetical protein